MDEDPPPFCDPAATEEPGFSGVIGFVADVENGFDDVVGFCAVGLVVGNMGFCWIFPAAFTDDDDDDDDEEESAVVENFEAPGFSVTPKGFCDAPCLSSSSLSVC
jgi:hypothetical protein